MSHLPIAVLEILTGFKNDGIGFLRAQCNKPEFEGACFVAGVSRNDGQTENIYQHRVDI